MRIVSSRRTCPRVRLLSSHPKDEARRVDRVDLSHSKTRPVPKGLQAGQVAAAALPGASGAFIRVLFLSDLDGTWLSANPQNRQRLDDEILQLRSSFQQRGVDLKFGYVTARPPQHLKALELPPPDYSVTFNGGRIERNGRCWEIWDRRQRGFTFSSARTREIAEELLRKEEFEGLRMRTVGQVVGKEDADSSPYQVTLCFPNSSIRLDSGDFVEEGDFRAPRQIEQFREQLAQQLHDQGFEAKFSPVYPFHRQPYCMFDVTTPIGNKGEAVKSLAQSLGIEPDHVIVAGDGGNDITMMTPERRAIVVGPNQPLRQAASANPLTYLADSQQDCSLAVLEGLQHHLGEIATARPERVR